MQAQGIPDERVPPAVPTGRIWRLLGEIAKPLLLMVAALAIGALLILASGKDPLAAYRSALTVLLSSPFKIGDIFLYATILLFVGAGLSIAFSANVWNIGAEGQLWIGALVGTGVALGAPSLPAWLLIPLVFGGAFLGGALWSFIPGFLKARFNTNEVLTSMLMCPIAVYLVRFLLWGPLRDVRTGFPQSRLIPEAAQLPVFVPGTRLNIGLFIALAVALAAFVLLRATIFGYRLRLTGASPRTAAYGGVRVSRTQLLTMLLSGGICGLAGAQLLTGVTHRLLEGLSPGEGFWGYGYMGIAVALMAKNSPLFAIGTSVLFAFLISTTFLLEASAGVSRYLLEFIQGLIILGVVWAYVIRR